jgi:hypothetical protein
MIAMRPVVYSPADELGTIIAMNDFKKAVSPLQLLQHLGYPLSHQQEIYPRAGLIRLKLSTKVKTAEAAAIVQGIPHEVPAPTFIGLLCR